MLPSSPVWLLSQIYPAGSRRQPSAEVMGGEEPDERGDEGEVQPVEALVQPFEGAAKFSDFSLELEAGCRDLFLQLRPRRRELRFDIANLDFDFAEALVHVLLEVVKAL